ncbi:hypothetical protein BX600DRAFT_511588 [Xylariales sp. PMI_506]|nr:hypothetical protein BX600DRAFT_511588 [Xylariales sp. PMI_506]
MVYFRPHGHDQTTINTGAISSSIKTYCPPRADDSAIAFPESLNAEDKRILERLRAAREQISRFVMRHAPGEIGGARSAATNQPEPLAPLHRERRAFQGLARVWTTHTKPTHPPCAPTPQLLEVFDSGSHKVVLVLDVSSTGFLLLQHASFSFQQSTKGLCNIEAQQSLPRRGNKDPNSGRSPIDESSAT